MKFKDKKGNIVIPKTKFMEKYMKESKLYEEVKEAKETKKEK